MQQEDYSYINLNTLGCMKAVQAVKMVYMEVTADFPKESMKSPYPACNKLLLYKFKNDIKSKMLC